MLNSSDVAWIAIMNEVMENNVCEMWTKQRDEYKIKLLVLAQRNERLFVVWIDTKRWPADRNMIIMLKVEDEWIEDEWRLNAEGWRWM